MEVFRFTGSARVALVFVLGLERHDKEYIHPALVQARWCNFDFFSSVRLGRIRKLMREENIGGQASYWVVSRTIEFYFQEQLVAEVSMIGQQYDRGQHCPRHTAWAVNGIRYARLFTDHKPGEWREVTWTPSGLTVTDFGGLGK